MRFHEIILDCHDYGVSLIIARKPSIDTGKVLPYFDWGVFGMIAVQHSVCGHNKEEITVVACKVFMAEMVGEFVVKIRPNSDVDIVLHADEEMIEQLVLAFAHADVIIVIAIIVVHRYVLVIEAGQFGLRVVQVEHHIVDLQDYEKFFSSKAH